MKLTKVQKMAVETLDRNILVSAGAGAGKTRVLVERFLNLVTQERALVTEILTLTFTEKAANEMKSRIMERLLQLGLHGARRKLESAYISTIHAFAARLLKEHPVEAGVAPNFAVLENEELYFLQERALDETIEKNCLQGSPVFELLRLYGEKEVRSGIRKAFRQARTEGLALSGFFSREAAGPGEVLARAETVFEKLGQKELFSEWVRFRDRPDWGWEAVDDFKEWFSSFSKRGGKKDKEDWRAAAALCKKLLGLKLDGMAAGLRASFEALALDFEARYEAFKFEEGVLDFDDLQMKALKIFESEKPSHRKLRERTRSHFKAVLIDEFQDINPLQMRLIEAVATEGSVFFVGDRKQSIYGFRGTSPAHFIEKEQLYAEGRSGMRLLMHENFRSGEPVLKFINAFFEKLWLEDGLAYEPLKAEGGVKPWDAELLVTEKKEQESLEQARMREASALARRILELHEEGTAFGDIAILFQAVTGVGIYEHALKTAGIPYFTVSGRGFYHKAEIRDMMSLLGFLENPLSDIPLAGALRSPFFRASDDTLFWLARYAKEKSEKTPLFDGFKRFEEIPEISEDEKGKLRFALQLMEELLESKDSLRLAELLDLILLRTSYELHALSDRQGIRRFANLKKLVHLAREYESQNLMSLSDFIRTIRHLEKTTEARESEAQVEAEESGRVVRLMSIHAAKGLEFEVCFVADLGNEGRSPESRTFLAQTGMGCSFVMKHPKTGKDEKPLSYLQIYEACEKRETEEWKRLFYVAATRAKSRLILSGVHAPKKEPKQAFNEMSSWMDWLMHAAGEMPVVVKKDPASHGHLRGSFVLAETKPFQEMLLEGKTFQEKKSTSAEEKAAVEQTRIILSGLETPPAMPSRVIDLPVSAYAAFHKDPLHYWRVYEIGQPEAREERDMEFFAAEDDVSPAELGTAVHRVLELMDFKNPAGTGPIFDEVFYGMNEKTVQDAKGLVGRFAASPVFKKLQNAAKLYRELGFVLNLRHGRVDGVIDLLFQDASGAWHVLDYKTGAGDAAKVEETGYGLQIAVYGLAVREILGHLPASGILYFMRNDWVQEVRFDEKVLSETAAHLARTQEKILAFTHQMHGLSQAAFAGS